MVSSRRLSLILLAGIASGAALLGGTTPASYIIQTIAGSNGPAEGSSALSAALSQPEGIAVDASGNIYFADAVANRVSKITTDGVIHTVAGTGTAGFAGDGGPATAALVNQPYGVAVDSAGNLYVADLGNARVRKVAVDGTIQTVAGGGTLAATGAGQGGPATMAQLIQPRNVALDSGGTLYISDFGANQIYKVTPEGSLLLVAGTGTAGYSGVGTSALLAQLNAPAGLTLDRSGALYFADSANNRVRKVYNGIIIDVFNTQAPTGVALDSTGMLYVAAAGYFGSVVQQMPGITSARDVTLDSAGHIFVTSGVFVLEVSSSGNVTTVAGSGGSLTFGGDGGPATQALLNSPSGLAYSTSGTSSGNLYIADTANNRIRMVTPAGVISTIAGTGDAGSSGDNGAATAAELNSPRGIVIDGAGNLYIADSGNNEVRKITPDGTITTIDSQLNNPVSVAVDSQGNVYIADFGDNQIVQVTAAGSANTFAKITGPLAVAVDASGDVMVADASQIWKITSNGSNSSLITGLSSPGAIAFASDGTLTIADTGANVIRQLSTSGVLTAIAGTGTAGFSGDGNAARSAQLNAPAGIAIGADGTILVADTANNRIRSLTPSSTASDTTSLSVVNAASDATGAIAPGEIVTIYGAGFDPTNTQVLFDGQPTTVFFTNATQINALAPATLAANSNTNVSVVVDGAPAASASVPVVAAAPGIFTTTGSTGQAAAVNQDGTINSSSNPALRGSVILLFATGQGSNSGNATVTIAGYDAPLLYAGPAPGFPGLMQINAQIPAGFLPPGIQQVTLSVGSVISQAGVTIAIH